MEGEYGGMIRRICRYVGCNAAVCAGYGKSGRGIESWSLLVYNPKLPNESIYVCEMKYNRIL